MLFKVGQINNTQSELAVLVELLPKQTCIPHTHMHTHARTHTCTHTHTHIYTHRHTHKPGGHGGSLLLQDKKENSHIQSHSWKGGNYKL